MVELALVSNFVYIFSELYFFDHLFKLRLLFFINSEHLSKISLFLFNTFIYRCFISLLLSECKIMLNKFVINSQNHL